VPADTENVRWSGKTGSDWRAPKTALLTQPEHLRGAVSTAGFICSRIHALCLLTNFPFVFSPISTSPQPSLISMLAARPKSAIS
jgi:hypothetical protein